MLAELRDLVRALENDTVIPSFQPIVELRTGALKGFEVLARWLHPDVGLVLPDNFIALAEDNGLIGELTNQVLRKAFQATGELQGQLRLSVNVSPRQMRYATLPGQIRNSAEEVGFPLDQLTIEITESALLGNLEQAGKIARGMKDMGCRLSLDDFGTGYSSLGHLQALPFDQIKIDRSFVESMTTRRESRKIVAAVLGLGHSLEMMTVAEGVEENAQAQMLLRLGCDLAQGFRYGRPLPAESLPSVIAARPLAVSMGTIGPAASTTSLLEALPAQRLAQMQAIYEGALVGLGFLDRHLRYVSLNQRLARMNGLPVEDHLGFSANTLFPTWFAQYEPHLRRALAGEAQLAVEVCAPLGGLPGKMLASFQPALDEANEVIGVSIAMLDVAELLPAAPAKGSGRASRSARKDAASWFLRAGEKNLQTSSH